MVLSLFPQQELAEDAKVEADALGACFTLAQCLHSTEEVDACFTHLKKHGVTITKEPEKVFWGGHSGYFADPDGHLWEIAQNPFLQMDEAGSVLGVRAGEYGSCPPLLMLGTIHPVGLRGEACAHQQAIGFSRTASVVGAGGAHALHLDQPGSAGFVQQPV